MSDFETWAAGLALSYSEPDRKTGKTMFAGDILIAIERELAQDAPLIADDTVIPEGGTLPAPPEAVHEAAIKAALACAFTLTQPIGAALRQNILDLVEAGDIRPPVAETWAKRFGWPPFADWAAFEHFDPRSLSTWTLAQAVCWIAHHESDPAGVHERMSRLDPARIAASTRWIATGDGYEIGPREDRGYSEPEDARTDAKAQLLAALRSGQIVAEGERNGAVSAIPREEWPRLAIIGFHDGEGVWRVVGAGHAGGDAETYKAARVSRASVLKGWPAMTLTTQPKLRPLYAATAARILDEIVKERAGEVPGKRLAEQLFKDRGWQGRDFIRAAVEALAPDRGPGRP